MRRLPGDIKGKFIQRTVKIWKFLLMHHLSRVHGHPELIKLIVEERTRRQKIKSKMLGKEGGQLGELQEEEIIT